MIMIGFAFTQRVDMNYLLVIENNYKLYLPSYYCVEDTDFIKWINGLTSYERNHIKRKYHRYYYYKIGPGNISFCEGFGYVN
jgi:hypothetical protein